MSRLISSNVRGAPCSFLCSVERLVKSGSAVACGVLQFAFPCPCVNTVALISSSGSGKLVCKQLMHYLPQRLFHRQSIGISDPLFERDPAIQIPHDWHRGLIQQGGLFRHFWSASRSSVMSCTRPRQWRGLPFCHNH